MKRLLLLLVPIALLLAFVSLPTPKEEVTPTLTGLAAKDFGLADAENDESVAFYRLEAATQGTPAVNYSWHVVEHKVPKDVYLVESQRVEAANYDEFARELKKKLGAKTEVKTVNLQDVGGITTSAVLVVASGAIPETLLDALPKLIEKNHTILFIGMPFTVTLNEDGSAQDAAGKWANESKKLGFEYLEAGKKKLNKHSLTKTEYAVRLNGENNSTQIHSYDDAVYAISYESQGNLAIIPTTLDRGWQTSEKAAEDIAQVITDAEWQPALTTRQTKATQLKNGANTLYSPPFKARTAYAQLEVTDGNATHTFTAYAASLSSRLIHSANVTFNQTLQITAALDENYPAPKELSLALHVYRDDEKKAEYALGSTRVKTLGFATTTTTITLEPGDYLAELGDQNNDLHARSFLHVKNTSVEFLKEDYGSGDFALRIIADGQPLANTGLTVSLDGSKNKTFSTNEDGIASFAMHADTRPTHELTIRAQDETLAFERPHVDTSFLNSPIAYAFYLLIPLMFGVGLVFQRKPKQRVYLDVPDYANEKTSAVEVHARDVEKAFEDANKQFKRKHLPLTLEEAKTALKEQLRLPARTTLTDYNTRHVLAQLEHDGVVKQAHGLYVLTAWEKQSRKTAAYLGLKRLAVDQLIQAGHEFTETKEGDLKTSNTTIHLPRENALQRIREAIYKTNNVLVLPSPEDVEEFVQRLRLSADELATAMYFELQQNSFRVVPLKQLAQEVKK